MYHNALILSKCLSVLSDVTKNANFWLKYRNQGV